MESQPEEAVQSEDAKEMAAPPTSAEVWLFFEWIVKYYETKACLIPSSSLTFGVCFI